MAPIARNLTPRRARGMSTTMMMALKMTAERMAEWGLSSFMMLMVFSAGNTPWNMAGMMAKYLATSLAMEKVVSEPRVMSSCLPISTISMSLVGLESRSTMLPASLAAWVPVFMATPTSAWARAGASLVPSPGHGHQVAAGLLGPDAGHLVLGRGLGHEVVDAGLLGDGLGGQGVVAGDHDGADAHGAHLGELGGDARLDRVLQVDDAEHAGDPRRRRAACRRRWRSSSTMAGRSGGHRARPAPRPSAAPSRRRPCGSSGRRHSMPDIRVWAVNGTSSASGMLDRLEAVPLLGQVHDGAALRVSRRPATTAAPPRPGRARRCRRRGGTRPPCGCRR